MKLGLVVDGGHWVFINELYAYWKTRYQTEVFAFQEIHPPFFRERTNRLRKKRALADFLAQNDVVFFEWAGPLLIQASRMPHHARIIVRLHSFELFEYAPQIDWDGVDCIVLVSETMQRHFCQMFPDAASKTLVVNNGVALDRFSNPERNFTGTIGMLGNLIPIKRVYEVILMFARLESFQLRLGGSPGNGADAERYMMAMQRLVRELGLQERVCFVGKVDAPAFLKQIDIFVSNSYWEGQQVALLEAMASGCYCLAHFWDGAQEILPAENLYVSEEELREKILDYAARSSDAKRQAQAHMSDIACAKFDFLQMRSRLCQLIEQE